MGDDGVGAFGCAYEEGASVGFGGKEGEWMVVGQEWVGGEECGQAGGVDACAVVYVVLCLHGDASVGGDGCPGHVVGCYGHVVGVAYGDVAQVECRHDVEAYDVAQLCHGITVLLGRP